MKPVDIMAWWREDSMIILWSATLS